ncbi:MAG: 4-alpha-glucanotransferase [bacterium]|nr:4-alpha-glucanotransferase [bacterium]
MHHSFRIKFDTSPGQAVQLVLDSGTVRLQWLGNGWWGGSADVSGAAHYHYRVVGADNLIVEEERPFRVAGSWSGETSMVVDRWRKRSADRLSRHSALFTRALAGGYPATEPVTVGSVRFRLHEPWIPKGLSPAVVGSIAALGSWDPAQAIPLAASPYPTWEVAVDVAGEAVEYKYLLLDGDGAVVTWESGPNRTLPPLSSGGTGVADDELRGIEPWRGAGVAVPVFSLRSERGIGVGEFADLMPFADWAADIGMSVIQLLPVNDTVLDHDWDDSYPYNPVSVQALHPMYVDVSAIDGHGVGGLLEKARSQLNDLEEIDYVTVMERKWSLLRAAYANVRDTLDDNGEYADFVDEEWEWLGPYSAWAMLRDLHGTGVTAQWGADATFDADRIAAMAVPGAPEYEGLQFHWFVQFHLNRQLKQAAAYVRSRGLALKGDLPIGVAPESVDVWMQPELFHIGAQTGAPPDAFAVRGQNWQFPTYNWTAMEDDGFRWWKDRFRALAEYVDVYRIDHVLGFFRIWEIPPGGFDGIVGHFRPTLPLTEDYIRAALGRVDLDTLTEPRVDRIEITEKFGVNAPAVLARFFPGPSVSPEFAPDVATQRMIRAAFADGALPDVVGSERTAMERSLLDMAADVLLVRVDDGFAPRISWQETGHYRRLDTGQQGRFDAMALDFFHHRHAQLWEEQGRRTLPAIVDAADLLTCGEDLGMVPELVPRIMNDLGLLSLEIERMPKRLGDWAADPADAPYLSVVSPGTHDTTTLRQWWAEEKASTDRYWSEALEGVGPTPSTLTPEVAAHILERQLASPAMLCIVPIADLLAIDGDLRRVDADTERINDPANRHNRWRYRIHLDTAELAAAAEFNDQVRSMILQSGR